MTIRQALIDHLIQSRKHVGSPDARPRALLWPDEEREWIDVAPRLRMEFPELLTLGDYDPTTKTGPAIYLLPLIDRTTPEADWDEATIPIVYLPGVGKASLRAVADLDWNLQPIAALQYQSRLWVQLANGKDWTRLAFATSTTGPIGWTIDSHEETKEAFRKTFVLWLDRQVSDWRGRTLTASDFYGSVIHDFAGLVLKWLAKPQEFESSQTPEVWDAFQDKAKKLLKLDLRKQTPLDGLAMLLQGPNSEWESVWTRFKESPNRHVNLVQLLEAIEPPKAVDLYTELDRYPLANRRREAELEATLQAAGATSPGELRQRVLAAEKAHGERRGWVWSSLGHSPLAAALKDLADLARGTSKSLQAANWDDWMAKYTGDAWKVDRAFLDSHADRVPLAHRALVQGLADQMYRPWVEEAAYYFQAMDSTTYPAKWPANPVPAPTSTCLYFVDGLRWDLGEALQLLLRTGGFAVDSAASWSALPTVTATAKPAVSPLVQLLGGSDSPQGFDPQFRDTGKLVTTYLFREQLKTSGWTYLDSSEVGSGEGNAWTETGALDTSGHDGTLESRFAAILEEIAFRVQSLLKAGWKTVQIVTDHGFLYLPRGLPHTEMPGKLALQKGERAALFHPDNPPTAVQAPWFWNPVASFQTGPGISTFWAGLGYTHGGLSVQECIVPRIAVRSSGLTVSAPTLTGAKWTKMRLKLDWSGDTSGHTMDLRTAAADSRTSVIDGRIPLGSSILVEDPDWEGKDVWLVVEDSSRAVVSQKPMKVGV